MQSYKNAVQIASSENPLEWWSKNESNFPRTGKLAKSYLAIPATSVPSEQSFSKAGYITEKRRSRLSSKHVKEILFLHYNERTKKKMVEWDESSDDDSEPESEAD